jgi:hypothetical protein
MAGRPGSGLHERRKDNGKLIEFICRENHLELAEALGTLK